MTDSSWTSWPAPAKLNLFLHIVGRRSDGYHLLQTVFQLLDFGDTVYLRPRQDGALVRIGELPGVSLRNDLCLRAAHLLQKHTGCRLGADIAIDKIIPIGGGLGGGSSDAASVLVGLNALWDTGLDNDALVALGLQLGADIPLFIHGDSAWAEGVGEILTPIELPERQPYVILDPQVIVPTQEMFQAPELTRNLSRITIDGFNAGAATKNVFESVVRTRYAPVSAALDWLNQFGAARLSGSGGCIFVAVPTPEEAAAVARQCPDWMFPYLARGINRSPLRNAVAMFAAGTSPSW